MLSKPPGISGTPYLTRTIANSVGCPEIPNRLDPRDRVALQEDHCKSGAVTILRRKIPLRLAYNRAG
jgi:hypothetical protein